MVLLIIISHFKLCFGHFIYIFNDLDSEYIYMYVQQISITELFSFLCLQ